MELSQSHCMAQVVGLKPCWLDHGSQRHSVSLFLGHGHSSLFEALCFCVDRDVKTLTPLSVSVHASDPSTREVKAGRSMLNLASPGLRSEIQASEV